MACPCPFIQTLSKFYQKFNPNFIQVFYKLTLSIFYPDFVLIKGHGRHSSLKSAVFLQRRKRIVKYYVKKFVKESQ